jgi:signal transduction histidine kinase
VSLHIADNGVGIMPADLTRTHTHGLMGMRQRVAARGGRFDIRRGELHGTDIHVVLPVPTVRGTKEDSLGVDRIVEEAPGTVPDSTSTQGHAPAERL